MIGPRTIQNSAFLNGSFVIKALNKESGPIAYDASSQDIKDSLANIGLPASEVLAVETRDTFLSGTKSWLITFEAYDTGFGISYDGPLLESNSSGLNGGSNAGVWHSVKRAGINSPTGISGGFHLIFRNQQQ